MNTQLNYIVAQNHAADLHASAARGRLAARDLPRTQTGSGRPSRIARVTAKLARLAARPARA